MVSTKYNARSISFPSRSHPSTARVEEHLHRLRTTISSSSSSSSESLSDGVLMLVELYEVVDQLLNMGSTQQVLSLSHPQNDDKHLETLLESSVRVLDVCGVSRDLLLQTNQHVRELQSALRRRKGDSTLEACVSSYVCFRNKAKKDVIKKLVSTLKQVNKKLLQEQDTSESNNDNGHFYAVMRVLRHVCEATVLVFQCLLSFMESKIKSNTKWSLVSKFIHKGAIACEDERLKCVNEFESVDSANIDALSLEGLESRVDGLEKGLEIVFRRMIKTRASLLNILSH